MPSFKYIGDVPKVQFRGITFPQGESVAVPDDIATQLSLNPCFEEVKVGRPKKAAEPKE
ncbi:MAG: hypothetical protein AAFN78_01035 [Pseudomonadota bacterium]